MDIVRVSRKRDGVGSPFQLEIESSSYDEQAMAYTEDLKPPYWLWLQCIRSYVDTADTLPFGLARNGVIRKIEEADRWNTVGLGIQI